jgi:hypothetical protein
MKDMNYRIVNDGPLHPPHLLVVAGQTGSGKTKVCELLNHNYGYESVGTGALIAEIIGVPPVPITPRPVFQEAAHQLFRTRAGVSRLTECIMAKCRELSTDKITIDGLRIPEVLAELRSSAAGCRVGVLFLEVPPRLAHRFYERRKGISIDYDSFLAIINAPIEREIDAFRSTADAVIVNDREGTLAETLHALMRELGLPRFTGYNGM